MAEIETEPTGSSSRTGGVRALVVGIAAIALIAAIPIAVAVLDDDDSSGSGGSQDAIATVRAAVGTTVGSGSYEYAFDSSTSQGVRFVGHGIVNYEPYAMVATTEVGSTIGNVVVHVSPTTVWQQGGAPMGYTPTGAPGVPLPDYLDRIVGTLGPGPGALAAMSLATRGGYLNLEQEALATAEPAGEGEVDGVPVTTTTSRSTTRSSQTQQI